MKNSSYFLIGGIIIGLIIGFFIPRDGSSPGEMANMAAVYNETTAAVSHTAHGTMEVDTNSPTPEVELIVHKDAKSGWNAQIELTNFTFAPESVSGEHVDGEGHAHIYVDGVKINRVYSEWYHLGDLAEGLHEVSVLLSSNDHMELTVEGEKISDSVQVDVSEFAEESHTHDKEESHTDSEDDKE